MYILIPGRHHVLTNYQYQYLFRMIHSGLDTEVDQSGQQFPDIAIKGIIFAVTSANHEGTQRNPLSFAYRAMAIQDFGSTLPVPVYCFPIEDAGYREDFASYTLKSIAHKSENQLDLTPQNTLVACSTPVAEMYRLQGFRIFGAETHEKDNPSAVMPWTLIEEIASTPAWKKNRHILNHLHPASFSLIDQYNLGKKIQFLFNDPIIGEDGDITETRDYNSYVRQMDEIAHLKWQDVAAFVRPGRIGDIGCSTGSWLKLAAQDQRLRESDFYGIEITRTLFNICQQRKDNREFCNPNIWFSQKNAVSGLVFKRESMTTIHSSSLTHEIESYGSRDDLVQFVKNRFQELQPGGVWINRDVIGPENREDIVLLWTNPEDGINTIEEDEQDLSKSSTRDRFYQFAQDFRKEEGYSLKFSEKKLGSLPVFELTAEDASEFLLSKDYTDNWQSEMHERFCFFSFSEWKSLLEEVGFEIVEGSRSFTNPWIAEHRFNGSVKLFSKEGEPRSYPPTNMIIVARKP